MKYNILTSKKKQYFKFKKTKRTNTLNLKKQRET